MAENVKLFFHLKDDAPYSTESVWAERATDGSLIVLNTPFYVKGVSYLDRVNFAIENGLFYFVDVIQKSRHSTYRILQQTEEQQGRFQEFWKLLQDAGCTYESKIDGSQVVYAVDVSPEADIQKVFAQLEKGEKESVWFFEEGDCVARY